MSCLPRKIFSTVVSLAFVGPLALASGGCNGSGDEGRDRSGKAVSGVQATRQELAKGRKQVDATLAALNALQSTQGDLRPAFDKYKKEVANLEKEAKVVTSRSADMRARAREYQQKWREEVAKVDNPDLRAAAQARAAKVRDRYQVIADKAQETRAAYEPFMRDLRDVQTYLSNDLTPAAVQAAKPVFEKAQASGREVQQKGDALAAEMDAVAAEISSGTPAPKS